MEIFAFALGAFLMLAGLGSLWASLNLVPTEMGMLYGVCGAVFIGCGAIVLAIGALIKRVGRPGFSRNEPTPRPAPVEQPPESIRVEPPLAVPAAEADATLMSPTVSLEPERPSAPSILAEAKDRTKSALQIIGRYAAGGANYVIFSDGTIEAETEQGAMRFSTMSEFRAFIAKRKV